MGRKNKPTALRVIEGNREHRPIPNNPKPKPELPKCPKNKNKEYKKIWNKLADELYRLGLLTIVDVPAFEMVIQSYMKWKEAEAKAVLGILKENSRGINPFINIALKYAAMFKSLSSDFGLTPASRSKLNLDDELQNNEWDGLLT